MKRIFVVCVSVVLFSCQNSDSSSQSGSYDSTIVTNNSITTPAASVTTDSTNMQSQVTGAPAPVTTMPAAQTQASAMSLSPAVTAASGLNPAHGQPGHRCEIAVGAPLNSAPAASAAKTTTSSASPSIISSPAASATPVKTAPGMNPPHGEPGHRCDISVGAPLNSAPAKPAADAGKQAPVVLPAASSAMDSAKP